MKEIKFDGVNLAVSGAGAPEGALALAVGYLQGRDDLVPYDVPAGFAAGVCADLGREAVVGEVKAEASADGVAYTVRSENGWMPIGRLPELPVVQFALAQAGTIEIGQRFEVPAALAAAALPGGGGAGATHPTAAIEAADGQSASASILKAYMQAAEQQCCAKGYFHQPFLVRYALRMADGTHMPASQPIAMLPSMLPPCLDAAAADAGDGKAVVTINGGRLRFFQLRARVLSGIPEAWRDMIASIDIFATAPISTFLPEAPANGGIVPYSTLLEQRCMAGGHRGRPAGEAEETLAYNGAWAANGDDYCDRYQSVAEAAAIMAWAVLPNPTLADDLANASEFHLIASIPASEIAAHADFKPLRTGSTSEAAIKKNPVLQGALMTGASIAPACLFALNGQLHAAGGERLLPAPCHLIPSLAPSEGLSVETRLWTISKSKGALRCSSAIISAPSLREAKPRLLFHPDSSANMLIAKQGDDCWAFPLQPHKALAGAVWCDFLSTEPGPEPENLGQILLSAGIAKTLPGDDDAAAMLDSLPSRVPEGNAMRAFAPGNPFAVVDATEVGEKAIIALRAAVHPMSEGQFGQYQIYAFASDSVWTVGVAHGRYASAALVAPCGCSSASSIASHPGGVAFASAKGIMQLSGSSCACISGDICAERSMPEMLAMLDRVLANSGIALAPLCDMLPRAQIHFDADAGALIVSSEGNQCAYIYSLQSGKWTMACPGAKARFVLTRPIRLSSDLEPSLPSLTALLGDGGKHSAYMALFGSNDLQRWRLMASSLSHAIGKIAGEGCRWAIVAASSPASTRARLRGCAFFRQK